MTVRILANGAGRALGKLADAELHFDAQDGPLSGLRLVGFGIWQRRSRGAARVTFPARSYSLGGQQRTFALLRPIAETADRGVDDRLREVILEAFEKLQETAV
jgi:hypothetical protein